MRDEWYVARRGQDGNKRYGPVSLQQLRDLVDSGKVRGEDLVWHEGMGNWQRADQCNDLAPASSPPPPPRREPRDSPPPGRQSYGYDRGPRGYGPRPEDDDRPYPRRYPQRQASSSGWIIGLVVGGLVLVVFFLGCGGFVLYLAMKPTTTYKPATTTTFTPPPLQLQKDPGNFNPNANPGAPPLLVNKVTFGQSEVYYTGTATFFDAQNVGTYLDGKGYFPNGGVDGLDGRRVTVQVDKDFQGDVKVRFCVKAGVAFDPPSEEFYTDLRNDMEQDVFNGNLITVELCDENMTTLEVLP